MLNNRFPPFQKPRRICFTPCVVKNAGRSFLLSGTSAAVAPLVGSVNCPNDFLLIRDGFDPIGGAVSDRYCGGAFNPSGVAADSSIQVCCTYLMQYFS